MTDVSATQHSSAAISAAAPTDRPMVDGVGAPSEPDQEAPPAAAADVSSASATEAHSDSRRVREQAADPSPDQPDPPSPSGVARGHEGAAVLDATNTGAERNEPGKPTTIEKTVLYSALISLLFGFLVLGWLSHQRPYDRMVDILADAQDVSGGCKAYFLYLAHFNQGGMFIRTLAVMLGAAVCFIGGIFIVYDARHSAYTLSVDSVGRAGSAGGMRATLSSASPGLIAITLGATVVFGAVYKTQDTSLDPGVCAGTTRSGSGTTTDDTAIEIDANDNSFWSGPTPIGEALEAGTPTGDPGRVEGR